MSSITRNNKVSTFFLMAVIALGVLLMAFGFSFPAPVQATTPQARHEISELEDARFSYEERTTESIYALLIPWLGDRGARVTVRAEMDYTQNENTQEILDIDNPALQSAKGDDVTYTYSKKTLQNKRSAGVVKKLSIAVLLDNQNRDFSPEMLTQLRRLIERAAGFNEARGDTIEIVQGNFVPTPFWKSALSPLLVLILLFILGGLIIKNTFAAKQIEAAPAVLPAFTRPEMVGTVGANAQIDGNVAPNALKKAQTLLTQKPNETLNLLRGWMCQTEGGVDEF